MTTSHQYTRCLIAMTLAHASMEVLSPALQNTPMQANVDRVSRWLSECREDLPHRKLSSGARRDIEAAIEKLAPHAETNGMDGEARLSAWTAKPACRAHVGGGLPDNVQGHRPRSMLAMA